MSKLLEVFNKIDSVVWGPPLLILLVGTGIYLTIRLGLLQVIRLPLALKYVFGKDDELEEEGDVSSFGALCTALSATIGTGNIVGVATAIQVGGPGALFWMWMAAFFGMATKYAEGLLAIRFRVTDENGQMAGGPMYYIERGLGNKWLAKMFAIFGVAVAFFGIGTFPQINAITQGVKLTFNIPIIITALVITIIVALVTLGGIKSIAAVSEKIVPLMAIFYIVGSITILIANAGALPETIKMVIEGAFTTTAAAGGFAGAGVMLAIRSGVARGVFSNESGLGSAPIAAAAAKTKSCVRQGLISMTGTFFDTIVICTMTGLVLISTGVWNSGLKGAAMTNQAFRTGLSSMPYIGELIVTVGLIFFAFTTILGWNYYGERCAVYLFGVKGIIPYRIIYIGLVAVGAFLKLDLIWILADIVNGLMAIPNLIAIVGLSGIIVSETRQFFKELKMK
ncbi:amino-acid carrier protein AlsT [Clostridium homopropionicum DSM 5847]|uniref:Amino-acid carrier protein AlsT n=1 Tax=Clostridium homopropionicum DSM 5847 TaxID=1121318 RepID=A0A0L6ZE09_9CLOT|nr:sodium:alanine symporter family protein [Clostridium homopropionicum]KOA21206.1 amino-acid carrier protein AlsT [Clostridium homopropionicum DSM 5847]SFG27260.1 alanine or glycine:cation symporter, AGCS family [Clostridium homopropionicum]